jgi:hypothetical protein
VHTLVGLIATGSLDDHLTTISTAIHERHQRLQRSHSHRALARIEIGDRVRLNHAVRPRYLHGTTGTVVGWAGQRVVVHLDEPTGRFVTGEVRCPALGLEILSS